jgi:hypothetical protein
MIGRKPVRVLNRESPTAFRILLKISGLCKAHELGFRSPVLLMGLCQ